MINFFKQKNKGFTLVETLVALSVVMIAVGGPLTLASQSLSAASLARNRMTATYLAQDAVETIKYKRDNNILSDELNWLQDLDGCIGESNSCGLSSDTGIITNCFGLECDPLLYDSTSGLYRQEVTPGFEESVYSRTINIVELTPNSSYPNEEIAITVTVSWNALGRTQSFVVRSNMLKWQ
jgi:prepilin-type N-terminal cleavage/methylation domain-containing protein